MKIQKKKSKSRVPVKSKTKPAQGRGAKKVKSVSKKGSKSADSSQNIGRKIKSLALQTQKSVSDQLFVKTEALKSKLSAYGIGVDDVKAGAKHLEQVLKDIRSRDFLKQPGVQALVERVTRKNIEKSNHEAQKAAERVPRKQQRLSKKQKEKLNRRFNALSDKDSKSISGIVVNAIMKRVNDVRKTLSSPLSSRAPRSESRKRLK